MRELSVAAGRHQANIVWPTRTWSWEEFLTWLDLDHPAARKDCGAFVGGKLAGKRRSKGDVVHRDLITLDADNASKSFFVDSATELNVASAYYTTWSHTPEKPRWRLVTPLSRSVAPGEHRLITSALMIELGYGQFDKGSTEPERLMHRPSTQGSYESHVVTGDWLDADEWLARAKELGLETQPERPAYMDDSPERYPALGVHPYAARAIASELALLDDFIYPWAPGDRWDDRLFAVACNLVEFGNSNWSGYSLDDALDDLLANAPTDEGWTEKNNIAKYESALARVAGHGRECPDSSPGDDFDAIEPDIETVPVEQADAFTREVEREARSLRIRETARELVAREKRAGAARPALVRLDAFLDIADDPMSYRVDQLWPTDGRIVLAAQNKSGKTTLTGNLIRCLVDGDALLGTFSVQKATRVVLMDNELSPNMIRRWLRDQGITKTGAVEVVSLRGKLSTFNILDTTVRAEWAAAIGTADALIFDCLRPALDALGLSEDKESGRFLEALDELTSEAGIPELLLVHHMGHSNERSRGDSRLEDWPDAKWRLVREDPDDQDSARYFGAFGRDVDYPESKLAFDPANRHLTITGGSRGQSKANQIQRECLAFIVENPSSSQSMIEREITGDRILVRKALSHLVDRGEIRREKKGQAFLHYAEISDFVDETAQSK